MKELSRQIQQLVAERDWARFHSPKNLSMALATESAEIMDIFRWLSEEESYQLSEQQRAQLADEIGDVLINLVNLASKFAIDPTQAAHEKLAKIRLKYPAPG